MSAVEIIEQATLEGVILALSSTGTITVTGHQSAVDRWLPTIRANKPSILCELHRERRRKKVLKMLEAEPSKHYAAHVDASVDPVIVAVCIRDIATFELEIPRKYYNGIVLLELIEKYSGEKYVNT